ncbi:MAG: hypothetical protein ACYDEI_08435 [Erysipelotrichaceae bacterium]
MKKIIFILLIMSLTACTQDAFLSRFDGLKPKTSYQNYKIYDLIEQKGLACAEAIEFIGNDDSYDYYFNCLKSDQIFFVSDEEVIKVKTFFEAGLISLEELYNLNIIDRMEKIK